MSTPSAFPAPQSSGATVGFSDPLQSSRTRGRITLKYPPCALAEVAGESETPPSDSRGRHGRDPAGRVHAGCDELQRAREHRPYARVWSLPAELAHRLAHVAAWLERQPT